MFVCALLLSCVQLFVILWTVDCQVLLSLGFLKQEYWSRLPFYTPGNLPNPGIELVSPALAGRFFSTEPPGRSIRWDSDPKMTVLIKETDASNVHREKAR